jgi:hypothetical protein
MLDHTIESALLGRSRAVLLLPVLASDPRRDMEDEDDRQWHR